MKLLTSTEPEYLLAESEKTLLTGKQLAFIVQQLQDMEVDSVVLSKEFKLRLAMLDRIINSLRELRLSVQEQE